MYKVQRIFMPKRTDLLANMDAYGRSELQASVPHAGVTTSMALYRSLRRRHWSLSYRPVIRGLLRQQNIDLGCSE